MIDDISYLKDNSETDSIAFYIDSSSRDMNTWPTPSEYSIQFDNPYRFVYGFDILDAAVPTTQYNIEKKNNTLAVTLLGAANDIAARNVVPPYLTELVDLTVFLDIFESESAIQALVVNQATVDAFSLSLATSTNPLYKALLRKEISGLTIAKYTNQSPADYHIFTYKSVDYAILKAGNSEAIDIVLYKDFFMDSSRIVYYEALLLDPLMYSNLYDNKNYIIAITNVRVSITMGNYDLGTFRNEINNVLAPLQYDLQMEPTSPLDTVQGRYKLTSQTNIIILNGRLTTMKDNIGLSMLPSSKYTDMYSTIKIGDNPYVFMSTYDSVNLVNAIESPGIVNLFGERYLILRIKEIEDHLLGSYSYASYSAGIGLFKLASSFNDVTNLRFDFVSLVRKPFHPIGKVSKLTLRFETSAGELYDFKGVNHQLLMVIKFLVPSQKKIFSRSILNPNYDPDFIKYMANNRTLQAKEDSDDEEEFDDELNRIKYRKMMNKYQEESSSDESESSEEDVNELAYRRRLLPA